MPVRMRSRPASPLRPPGDVDLRGVAGDDGLGPEPDPGEEHLHLLGRRVLRLVEDDERRVERVVGDQEVVGHVERIRGGDLMHTVSASPAGSMDSTIRMGLPPSKRR